MAQTTHRRRLQFGTTAILWLMVTLGMTLAYVARLSAADQRLGLAFVAAALAGASVVGLATRNLADAWFWSPLVTMLAYLAVMGERNPDRDVAYGWALVGAFCGGLCGVRQPRSALGGALASALLGAALMAAYVVWGGPAVPRFLAMLDVSSAAIVGAMLRGLVEIIEWFEARSGQGRHIIAAWLTLAVIIGNLLLPIMGPG